MAGPTVEQDVVIDANAQQLFAAMAKIDQQIQGIRRSVGAMGDDVINDAKKFERAMAAIGSKMQSAKMSLATLSQVNNTPGGQIMDLNNNRGLARATRQATEYARALNTARNSVEAIDAKMAALNQRIAQRGSQGMFATIAQTDQLKKLEQASKMLRQLDSDFERLQLRARRTRGADLTSEMQAVMSAREKLFAAASNGRRTNLGPELLAVNDAQVALADRLTIARQAEATALRNSLKMRRELALADVAGIKDVTALEAARVANARRIAELRAELRTANNIERNQLLENLNIEKARGAQIRSNLSEANRLARAESGGSGGGGGAPPRSGLGKYLPAGGIGAVAARTLAYGGVASLAFGAVNAVGDAASFGTQFEDELARLQAIAGATGYQMQQLRGAILDVGSSSRFSVIDLTKISQTLAQAGVSAGEMQKVLQSVTTLATASGSTPDEAVNLVTGALGAFQLQANETARVADLMTEALNRTKLTVGQVGQAIQYVGATAYEQNISLEELLATVGAMAQAGIRSGSTIGTGLRQFLVDLQTPSEKLQKQLESVGLTIADVNVAVKGEAAVIETLSKAGFGAQQAYSGLETRAAAAYLVLKNNVDVMDQLRVAFAQQGAAALANERAMDSLSAQWQRFKNIVAEGFSDSIQSTLDLAKNIIRDLSDAIDAAKAARQDGSYAAYTNQLGGLAGTATYINDKSGQLEDQVINRVTESLKIMQRAALDGFGTLDALNAMFGTSFEGLGTAYEKWAAGVSRTDAATRDLDTRMAEHNEKVSEQAGLIGQVDKEMTRLLTQHESLQGNSVRTTAETVTLMSKFEGLSKYLVGVTGDYNGLIDAMAKYRNEAAGTMAQILSGQIAAQGEVASVAGQVGSQARARIWANKDLMAKLSPQERAALQKPRDPANANIIAEAGEKYNNSDLRTLAQSVGQIAGALAEQNAARTRRDAALTQTRTPAGQRLTANTTRAEAMLTELGGLNGEARTARASEAKKLAEQIVVETTKRIDRAQPNDPALGQLKDWRTRAEAVVKGISAALAPTKAEEKAAKSAATEASRQPKITQADIDALGAAMGLRLGSGVRSAAEQNALHAAGKTKATAATSSHSNGGVARDFRTGALTDEQGAQLEAAAKKYFADRGITGLHIKYESGRGKNNGSGPHLHINARPGARKSGPESDGGDAFQTQRELNSDQTQIDQKAFTSALRVIKDASSQALFTSTVQSAQNALDRLNADLVRNATDELASNGIFVQDLFSSDNPKVRAKAEQVRESMRQNAEQFQSAVADGMISAVQDQIKAATTAAQLAMKPFDDRVAAAQGTVQGLGLYSNRFTPDYVKNVASARVSQEQEAQVRARAATIPAEIANKESAILNFQSQIDSQQLSGDALEKTKVTMQELVKAVADLRTEKANLDAQLGTAGLVPTTFDEGIAKAIESFRTANNLTQTFKQDVIDNLGGAVEMVSGSLSEMFTGILTGTQSAIGAFGSFAKSIIQYIQQMVAKILASKVLELLFNVVGGLIGGKAPTAGAAETSTFLSNVGLQGGGLFEGGRVGYAGGGRVMNGTSLRDSVDAKLAQGEWVINKAAVDSVGNDFMADLNKNGAGALKAMQTVPVLPPPARQETNVYVVAPDRVPPQMGKDDVLLTIADDILSGGDTAKLIKHVSNGG